MLVISMAVSAQSSAQQTVFVEAEMFTNHGGWELDQQAMEAMGSPYLLAHGLGIPVKDATTKVKFAEAGEYKVWVRTRDWVAPWKAPGAPGKFQVIVNNKALKPTFGTVGADWHWQPGGTVTIKKGENEIALHDLTGFEGRCDAIVFSKARGFTPPEETQSLKKFRFAMLGISEKPKDGGNYDFVVVGGGLAGTCAAISAARNGLKVILIQDRPVLGGNSSSEVRVWPEGKTLQKPHPHIGEIVEELVPQKGPGDGNAKDKDRYGDDRKLRIVQAEPGIKLLLNHRVNEVLMKDGKIAGVIAQGTRTSQKLKITGSLFADCTGDASIGFMAGANFEMSQEGKMGASNLWNLVDTSKPEELIKCECKDKDALTIAMNVGVTEQSFPRCPWALDLTDKPFPGRKSLNGQWENKPLQNLGGWFWETGYDLDMIKDIERIRDQNLRAMYGAWDALKNVDHLYPNHRLNWVAFIAGKRESRRLMGDVVLTGDDFRTGRKFEDGVFPCSWHIDLHAPDPQFSKGVKGQEFISRATDSPEFRYQGPYWAPYRALYSKNIPNLFMAGRNISVNSEGLGPVRVMRTTGMMGEVVGKAAWICAQKKCNPRDVYESHLPQLLEMLDQPAKLRRPAMR